VAANEPFAGGINLKMAGDFTAAGSVLDVGKFAGFRIAFVNDDGVVPAV